MQSYRSVYVNSEESMEISVVRYSLIDDFNYFYVLYFNRNPPMYAVSISRFKALLIITLLVVFVVTIVVPIVLFKYSNNQSTLSTIIKGNHILELLRVCRLYFLFCFSFAKDFNESVINYHRRFCGITFILI
jgi:hypothetical protein